MLHPLATLVIPARAVLVPIGLACIVLALVALHRRRVLTPWRATTVVALTGYLAIVARLTILPLHLTFGGASGRPWYDQVNLVPIATIDLPTFLPNIVMTVPFGLLLPLVRRVERTSTAALAGLGLSLLIETTQAVTQILFAGGRLGDVNDLIANTLGAVVGFTVLQAVTSTGQGARLVRAFRLPNLNHVPQDWPADADRVTPVG